MITYAFRKIPFFVESEKATVFPELWIIAQKQQLKPQPCAGSLESKAFDLIQKP
jgi:hypothetical protein